MLRYAQVKIIPFEKLNFEREHDRSFFENEETVE